MKKETLLRLEPKISVKDKPDHIPQKDLLGYVEGPITSTHGASGLAVNFHCDGLGHICIVGTSEEALEKAWNMFPNATHMDKSRLQKVIIVGDKR